MYNLNLRQVTYALSEALDLVGIDDHYHGKRVAFMAYTLSKSLGMTQEQIDDMTIIGMLHDCGVSNTDIHQNLVQELDWVGSQDHCVRGRALMEKVSIYKSYADVIFYHHTHWSTLQNEAVDDQTKQQANIILLVDRVDALRAQGKERQEIYDLLEQNTPSMFSPQLVETFKAISQSESFWFYLDSSNLEIFLQDWIKEAKEESHAYVTLKEIALMFSDIVDTKSSFTHEHSLNVAKVATYLAHKMNLEQDRVEILELAGLLHDLGKLRVKDEILEKNGPLNDQERAIMDRHGFDSEMILRKVDGFKDIATLTSLHHESLDGKGYPYKKEADQINIEARILMLSDIFQALVQKRPYRKSLECSQVMEILMQMKEQGKVDPHILNIIDQNREELYALAAS